MNKSVVERIYLATDQYYTANSHLPTKIMMSWKDYKELQVYHKLNPSSLLLNDAEDEFNSIPICVDAMATEVVAMGEGQ